MGVIKKILYRGNILGKPRHSNLFLDMEENIHIHYRDLRIELSRGEFEEIASTFNKQSAELQAIIKEKNYQDGKLANANQDDVRIWTESRLKQGVKYYPQRFSLEECGDGYHFHYRNYKLLIDKEEFRQIAHLFKTLDIDAPYASTYDEVVQLLEDNDVDFVTDAGNIPGEVLAISVAYYHMPKVRDIFRYINFKTEKDEPAEKQYSGKRLTVVVRPDRQRSAMDYRQLRANQSVVRLVDYLVGSGAAMDANDLNQLGCQVLDLYFAVNSGKARDVNTDPQSWFYSPANRQVIFPYKPANESAKAAAEKLYCAWRELLNSLRLNFVKPAKEVLPATEQAVLKRKIDEILMREIAAFTAVDRIYVMGSAVREDMGRYRAPFVHGKLAKLGSDIDILVEIGADREDDIPAHWNCYLSSASNHCAVYHIAQIPLTGGFDEWQRLFPNIPFTHHLVDAYVYFPSRGYREETDAFLSKFKAQLFYDRARDSVVYYGDEEARIAKRVAEIYGFPTVAVEKMKVSTENAIFKVFADNQKLVLKLFKVSGNYSGSRVAEHTVYEEKLVAALKERAIPTAGIIHAPLRVDTTIEGYSALLFDRVPGKVEQRPEYPLDKICAAFAKIHRVQMEKPLELAASFHFDEACMIWLPAFDGYLNITQQLPEIAKALADLAPLAARWHPGENREVLFSRSVSVHCHGDVTPKNVIVGESGEPCFFDFNNAFFGPRMVDIVDGAFEFSLAEKYIHLADFARFDRFIAYYLEQNPLTAEEVQDLPLWISLIGIIKFTKEVRVLLERPQESLRHKRALAIAEFTLARVGC
ncbi:MAG: phosphotransferase enzyme family protein [Methylobacter sp.]